MTPTMPLATAGFDYSHLARQLRHGLEGLQRRPFLDSSIKVILDDPDKTPQKLEIAEALCIANPVW